MTLVQDERPPQVPTPRRVPATAPGAYGLRISGLGDSRLLTSVDADAPTLTVTVELGASDGRVQAVTENHAEAELLDGAWLSIDRDGSAHFVMPKPVSSEELLHPWLVPAAGAFNGWLGRQVAHGGAFAINNSAVALLGDKQDGKSSLLAWLSRADDVEILTDDLLVFDQGRLLAGPRCVDLRSQSLHIIERRDSRLVREGTRLRLTLPPCRPSAKLSAIVLLSWGSEDHVSLVQLGATDALPALLPHTQRVAEGAGLLELLSVPVWRLTRPHTWSSLPEVEQSLRSLLDGSA